MFDYQMPIYGFNIDSQNSSIRFIGSWPELFQKVGAKSSSSSSHQTKVTDQTKVTSGDDVNDSPID